MKDFREVPECIPNELMELGVPVSVKGFKYLCSAIDYISNNPDSSWTKEVYPEVAKMYDTTSSRVERAVRHAVELSFARGDSLALSRMFPRVSEYSGKVTNSEFISTIAFRLRTKLHR